MRHIVLLQGPLGPFLSVLARELEAEGVRVTKIALNGGDAFFTPNKNLLKYRGSVEDWPRFLSEYVAKQNVTDFVCYSDCRLYHKAANDLAKANDLNFWVLEEGYLRPDYFTLELNGVNAHSELKPNVKLLEAYNKERKPAPYEINGTFTRRMCFGMAYYFFKFLSNRQYPLYDHHRTRSEFMEGIGWIVAGIRKQCYKLQQRNFFVRLEGKKYYLLPLQMHEDFQLREHSSYSSMVEVIKEVMQSFAEHAPEDAVLVIKHHPIDRGFHHYGAYIRELQYSLKLKNRVFYVHDVHLPTLLKRALGVVTVNSTVGISALYHGCPVKVLGEAIYDLEGITYQESLQHFWKCTLSPNDELVKKLIAYLRNETQLNACFYKDMPWAAKKVVKRMLRASEQMRAKIRLVESKKAS